MTLAKYTDLSLADARVTASLKMQQLRQGVDPLLEKRRSEQGTIKTVDDLFVDWQEGNVKRLKHPSIPARVYRKDIAPIIGEIKLDSINARDIRQILISINKSGRPTICNDALVTISNNKSNVVRIDLDNVVSAPNLLFYFFDTAFNIDTTYFHFDKPC